MPAKKIYDISVALQESTPVWPGDAGFQRMLTNRLSDGDISNCSRLSLGAHTGTHLDTPLHFLEGKQSLDDFGPERFVLPAEVFAVDDPVCIRAEHLADTTASSGEAILFKTLNSTRDIYRSGNFDTGYVYLAPDAAQVCVDRGFTLVGMDYLSVDAYGAADFPAHRILLGAGVIPLEGLDLQHVPPGRYTLIALPLKLAGSEASPVRAVLMTQ